MHNLLESFRLYRDKRFVFILLLGFLSGLPLNIISSSMIFWMKYALVGNAIIGLFSLVRMPYSFKFLWAPLLEKYSIPVISRRLGNRKAWALLFQLLMFVCVMCLTALDPERHLGLIFAIGAGLALSSSSFDIMVDTVKIKMLEDEEQGAGAGVANIGYRLGMMASGAVALFVSDYISWSSIFFVLAAVIAVGTVVILLVRERREEEKGPISASFWEPFWDFMQKDDWLFILVFIIAYKLCNAVLGNMAQPFYVDMGFTAREIAVTSKVLGTLVILGGGIVGGIIVLRYDILKSLFIAGVFEIFTSFSFALLSLMGPNVYMLAAVIVFDNIIGGIGGVIFVAYAISLCSKKYTASQFALVTSFAALAYNTLGSFSGFLVEAVGWPKFFIIDGFLMVPALFMLLVLMRRRRPSL